MINNKRFALIFIIFAVLPLVLAVFFQDTHKSVGRILLTGSFVVSLIIIFLNYYSQNPKSFWYTIPILLVFIIIIALYFSDNSLGTF